MYGFVLYKKNHATHRGASVRYCGFIPHDNAKLIALNAMFLGVVSVLQAKKYDKNKNVVQVMTLSLVDAPITTTGAAIKIETT